MGAPTFARTTSLSVLARLVRIGGGPPLLVVVVVETKEDEGEDDEEGDEEEEEGDVASLGFLWVSALSCSPSSFVGSLFPILFYIFIFSVTYFIKIGNKEIHHHDNF